MASAPQLSVWLALRAGRNAPRAMNRSLLTAVGLRRHDGKNLGIAPVTVLSSQMLAAIESNHLAGH